MYHFPPSAILGNLHLHSFRDLGGSGVGGGGNKEINNFEWMEFFVPSKANVMY